MKVHLLITLEEAFDAEAQIEEICATEDIAEEQKQSIEELADYEKVWVEEMEVKSKLHNQSPGALKLKDLMNQSDKDEYREALNDIDDVSQIRLEELQEKIDNCKRCQETQELEGNEETCQMHHHIPALKDELGERFRL